MGTVNLIPSFLPKKKLLLVSILLMALLVIILSVANLNSRFDIRKQAAESQDPIAVLNNQLIKCSKEKKKISICTLIAKQRKQLLLNEISNNPESFLRHALSPQTREALPKPLKIQKLIEEELEVKGKWTLIHMDDFSNKRSLNIYRIVAGEKTYNLHFTKDPPIISNGATVTIRGLALDSEIVLDLTQDKTNSLLILSSLSPPTTGNFKLAVLMFNFSNYRLEPFTKEQIASVVFSGRESVNAYYTEASFGQTSFPGDVHDIWGWLEIDSTSENCVHFIFLWTEKVKALASAQGFNSANYDRVAYLFPSIENCSFGGMAGLNEIWINGMNVGNIPDSKVFIHELGHTFGLLHANSISCGNKAIDIYANCQVKEYYDRYSAMGLQKNHFNAGEKDKLGWIPASRIKDVTESGIYELYPLERLETGYQILRIPKLDTNQYYYLEYRQPIGTFDSSLPTNIHNTLIHIWNENQFFINRLAGTFIIDTMPSTIYEADEALTDGTTFQDESNSISVTQLSHNATSATISITLPITTPTPTPTPTSGHVFGQAIQLNSSNPGFVEIPASERLLMGENFAIGVWVKPDAKTISGPNKSNPSFILAKEGIPNEGWGYGLDIANGKIEFSVNLKKTDGTRVRKYLLSKSTLIANQWYFINAIKSGNNLSLFINGQLESQLLLGGVGERIWEKETTLLTIGCAKMRNFPSCLSQFSGVIDEIRLSDIAEWAGFPKKPFIASEHTLALWHFDGNINDYSGDILHGQITGNVQFVDSNIRE